MSLPDRLFPELMAELRTDFRKKLKWGLLIALGLILLGLIDKPERPDIKRVKPPHANTEQDAQITDRIVAAYNVRRLFDGRMWGSFWDHCGVTLTADHVPSSMPDDGEAFVGAPVHRSGGLIDAAWYGEKWTCAAPLNPAEDMPVYILGYPAGSKQPTLRQGKVYLRRPTSGSHGYEISTWVVVFDHSAEILTEPVVGGMSGGIVTDIDLNPIGILVTQNSPADIDRDGRPEQSADIVGLLDAYNALIK